MKVTSSPPTSALRMRSRRKGNVMWMMWVTWLVKVLEAGVPPVSSESRLSEIVTATKHPNTSTSLTTLPILESYALPTGRPPPFHTPDGYLQLSVTSSAHLLFVSVNDKVVMQVSTTRNNVSTAHDHYTAWEQTSGLYVFVLHPSDGRVMLQRVLSTAIFGEGLEVPSVFASLTPGHILVLAIKNDAAQNLSKESRRLLYRLGVLSVGTLDKREYLAWVGIIGGPAWAEARTLDAEVELGMVWASGVTLDVLVPRVLHDSSCLGERRGFRETARARFCSLYDGYGSLCSCPTPAPLVYEPPELEGNSIMDVPLLILASNRPNYLYRNLVTVLRQAGASRDRILVLVDGHYQQVTDLLNLLQVQYEVRTAWGVTVGARISDQYRYALSLVFRRFLQASKAILLEEDLIVAPDFFSYFNQTAWLLDADPSLCCVSAWTDLGGLHTAHDPRLLRRVEVLPGLGWMVSRTTALHLLSMWMSPNQDHDWDIWMRQPDVLGGRECVMPDVSRTFHIGIMGSHAAGLLHTAFFAYKPVPALPYVPLLNVHRLQQSEYEEDIYKLLEDEVFLLQSALHPCHPDYLPRNFTEHPVVIFVEMTMPGDFLAWQFLARCLGVWDLDTRAHHRGLFRFFFYDTEVLVIGYPFSDYSFLKPPWLSMLEVNKTEEVEKLNLMPLTHRSRFRRPALERSVPFLDVPAPVFF
ncbi:protein O-linked-mannose beta-1,2-N-acetylglucosaminyltransferase 1-like isoform X2 [Portunus trituberculatus]|nr:protein O-linked-mannose beta-1,2-N-acetylglucosaminyltransferase 1-like isoform X2 [Portunus trituberculatus]XP_045113474.1 protein O-linked-mannose beta-1,2-N-acetylglucosaminyltransferase 1-like isoform X2 [Portunus trituberculatus]